MIAMNTYDFDKTIFDPDSSYCFYLYCLRHYPGAMVKTLPRSIAGGLRYAAGKGNTKMLKEQLFSFLPNLPDVDGAVKDFWDENRQRLAKWYLRQKRSDDVIISASPEFLLRPVCDELGVRLIGTRMDKHTGKISGENCHDKEKVRRFYEEFPGACTEEFYSDSLSDTPMAKIAQRAYIVRKEKLSPWPF